MASLAGFESTALLIQPPFEFGARHEPNCTTHPFGSQQMRFTGLDIILAIQQSGVASDLVTISVQEKNLSLAYFTCAARLAAAGRKRLNDRSEHSVYGLLVLEHFRDAGSQRNNYGVKPSLAGEPVRP